MNVEVNGSSREIDNVSVYQLLLHEQIDPLQPGVAVAVNDRVVRRAEWGHTNLNDGDRIEIITATAGG